MKNALLMLSMVAAFALGDTTAAHTDVVLDLGKGVYNPSLVVYQVSLSSHGPPLLHERQDAATNLAP